MLTNKRKKKMCAWTNYRDGSVCGRQADYQITYKDGVRERFCAAHYRLVKSWVAGITVVKLRKSK